MKNECVHWDTKHSTYILDNDALLEFHRIDLGNWILDLKLPQLMIIIELEGFI